MILGYAECFRRHYYVAADRPKAADRPRAAYVERSVTSLLVVLATAIAAPACLAGSTIDPALPHSPYLFPPAPASGLPVPDDLERYTIGKPNVFGEREITGEDRDGNRVRITCSHPDTFGEVHCQRR